MSYQSADVGVLNGAGLAVLCVQLGPGEAMVETERSRDFNKETVADFFLLCGPFFLNQK